MAAKRREVRETAFILSFEKLFRDEPIDDIIKLSEECDGLKIDEEAVRLVKGILERQDELDGIISRFSNKRSIERIPKINLAIIRLAIYEALYDEKVPVNVAISEAVALAQKYAQEPDIAFINGVLGSYSRSGDAPSNE
ncbi:transcription antitermination factor NusB [Ruminococcus sp. Marseille-P6503]|uniref:transcription antitermination factor NusB n=1 Tax=Ruminococcus sp. Marseille-P6503 TaxID=2364796 RepID=UPI000F548E3F|nr:transcription antitermination factor NusB [Ruminococcus sp. Marseille-P6503]